MTNILNTILTTSFHGSVVILAVLLARLVLRRAPKKYICLLWMLAGIRLLLPIPIESAYSLQPTSIAFTIPAGWATALAVVWLALAAAIGIYSLGSYIHLRRKVLDAVQVPGGWESDRIDTAFVLGFIRPKIYIPARMSQQDRAQILAHERTHLDKGDHWIKMIGFLALALHWFNPLVWVSYVLLCKDIEMACDERVVQFMEPGERKAYSLALLNCSTRKPHYAACPVAFGEVSVKYRIKSILNYRKPAFWLSLMAIEALLFVTVCLMTNPQVAADPDEPLRQISQADPAQFTPATTPAMEDMPDWGLSLILNPQSTTTGELVLVAQERFAAVSEGLELSGTRLDRWNGQAWEALPYDGNSSSLLELHGLHLAQRRDLPVTCHTTEADWSLSYGALAAGDYRLCVTIADSPGEAEFYAPFHIYRQELPSEQEAALERCQTALATLAGSSHYALTLSASAPDGQVYPTMELTAAGGNFEVKHYVGDCLVSSAVSAPMPYALANWDAPFRLDQNRQFLFPEGQSTISQEEITFRSVWADWQGIAYRGTDTYRFRADGTLASAERVVETLDEDGAVADRQVQRLERTDSGNIYLDVPYQEKDSFTSLEDSPWGIFFRVDDDLLSPSGGEVWISAQAMGVSNYTTDGTYWLEKRGHSGWELLGDQEARWGDETIPLTSQTTFTQVDWSQDYGVLEPGVYRMGKRFYNGTESIIQYAEFTIRQVGGVYGDGAQEALDRVDAAIARLKSAPYRAEMYTSGHSEYDQNSYLDQVYWKYDGTVVVDFYNDAGAYSHSVAMRSEEDVFYDTWLKRASFETEYDSVYFPAGYSLISDREIRLVYAYSMDAQENPATLYTYRFDEAGNLTEIGLQRLGGDWAGDTIHYTVTDTPTADIRAWVEQISASS